jgi:prepilin-type N-terminal cleavage/methylation domain-containing protein
MTDIASAFSDTQKTRKPSITSVGGFSLIELMVAMAMACIVLAAIYSLHAALMKSYTSQNAAADVQEGMRAGIDFVAEDILMAGFNPMGTAGAGIVAADATSIHFTSDRNMNGAIDASDLEEIRYFLSGAQLIQELYGDNTTDDVLVDNVTSLAFSYFDSAVPPNPLVPPLSATQLADIRTIALSMTVQAPAGRGEKVTRMYTTRFRVRNLDL